jgi:hypothetical protein
VTALYLVSLAALLILAFTRWRIWALCGFYLVYGTVKVIAQEDMANWSQLLLFRCLYPVLAVSVLVRYFRDPTLLRQIRYWPVLAYCSLLVTILLQALYSQSANTFSGSSPFNIWGGLVITSLFWFSAAHIRSPTDLNVFAASTVVVSIVLSSWVLWTTAQLDFSAFRGGIEVNQNLVSLFVLAGAIPLVHAQFRVSGYAKRSAVFLLVGFAMFGAFLLASRGVLIAFLVAVLIMAPKLIPGKPLKGFFAISFVLCFALFLPGAFAALSGRFHEGDESALNGREQVWSYSIHRFSDSGLLHILFGSGYNSAAVILPSAMEPNSWNYHNEYLNSLMDGGLIGLGAFALFLVVTWRLISKTDHSLKNVMRGWLVFLIVAGFSGVISGVHVFWPLLGAVCGGIAAQKVPPAIKSSSPFDFFDKNSYGLIHGSVQELLQNQSLSHRALSAYRHWRNGIHKSVQEDLRNVGR